MDEKPNNHVDNLGAFVHAMKKTIKIVNVLQRLGIRGIYVNSAHRGRKAESNKK